jgi:broad specificity phosphatase PhoE
MIEELKKYSADSKIAMLIRHADREPIPEGDFGNEIPINETGKKNAIEFGAKLKEHQINKILTSPIYRCIQTAEHISRGYGQKLEITVTKSLGDPGLHLSDEQLAGEFYLKHGFEELYRKFINGEEMPGVVTPKAYHDKMDTLLKEHTSEKGLTIFVTHDSLIAFYDFCISGRIYSKENWVKYLTGLVLKQ